MTTTILESTVVEIPEILATIKTFTICPTDKLLQPIVHTYYGPPYWSHDPESFLRSHIWHLAGALWNARDHLRIFPGKENRQPGEYHGFGPTIVFVELQSSFVLPTRPLLPKPVCSMAHLVFVTQESVNRTPTELVQILVNQKELRWHDIAVNCRAVQ